MVLTLKHRIRYYRKFGVDIGGLKKLSVIKSSQQKFKRIFKFFLKKKKERVKKGKERHQRYIYQINIARTFTKKRVLKKRFATVRLVKLFFLTLTYKQFNRIARAAKKKDGFFGDHFLLALEGRLLSMLYRTSFVSNMFESLFFVKNSFITLNKKVHSYSNQQVNLYTILSFHPIIKNRIYFSLAERLIKNKRSLFNPPKYFFISYWFLFAYMFKAPQQKKLVKTGRGFDIYKVIGFTS